MAKITRAKQELFAYNGGTSTSNCAQFGSLKAGSANFTLDPDTIQALAAWDLGWKGAVINNNAPPIQDMNAVQFVLSRQIAYTLQTGVPEWNTDTTYYIGSVVNGGDGKLYRSITDDNAGNALTDLTNWTEYVGLGMDRTLYAESVAAVSGGKLLIDCSAAVRTVTLPASPVVGDVIVIYDAKKSAATYNITVARNGNNINGAASDFTINTNGVRLELVYVDASTGWSTFI